MRVISSHSLSAHSVQFAQSSSGEFAQQLLCSIEQHVGSLISIYFEINDIIR